MSFSRCNRTISFIPWLFCLWHRQIAALRKNDVYAVQVLYYAYCSRNVLSAMLTTFDSLPLSTGHLLPALRLINYDMVIRFTTDLGHMSSFSYAYFQEILNSEIIFWNRRRHQLLRRIPVELHICAVFEKFGERRTVNQGDKLAAV